jgi:hypothetical protein
MSLHSEQARLVINGSDISFIGVSLPRTINEPLIMDLYKSLPQYTDLELRVPIHTEDFFMDWTIQMSSSRSSNDYKKQVELIIEGQHFIFEGCLITYYQIINNELYINVRFDNYKIIRSSIYSDTRKNLSSEMDLNRKETNKERLLDLNDAISRYNDNSFENKRILDLK